LDFLKKHPGLAFQSSALAANINEITVEQATSAISSLYLRSLIKRKVGAKKSTAGIGAYSYYYEPDED
jgi:hypothetical protein